jgi:ribosomal subunit interface protein
MDITFKGRHTSVPERFRRHASVKLAKLEKLDQRAFRIDVQVSKERNPRQSDHSERVELTIRSRGPAIRAEAAADDRYAALDLALAKLEARMRRASERRKVRRGDLSVRSADVLAAVAAAPDGMDAVSAMDELEDLEDAPAPHNGRGRAEARGRAEVKGGASRASGRHRNARPQFVVPLPEAPRAPEGDGEADAAGGHDGAPSGLVPIQMEGDGPLIVREKFHQSRPMTIDKALLEMELVGHDFFAFHDKECDKFSVVYRRCGYDYGVIRLVEGDAVL